MPHIKKHEDAVKIHRACYFSMAINELLWLDVQQIPRSIRLKLRLSEI